MFIHFEFLVDTGGEAKVNVVISSVEEAKTFMSLLEYSPKIVAWKMTSHKPEEFGMAPGTSPIWKKLRADNRFTVEDWEKVRGQ